MQFLPQSLNDAQTGHSKRIINLSTDQKVGGKNNAAGKKVV
jgi:hypothetical protein